MPASAPCPSCSRRRSAARARRACAAVGGAAVIESWLERKSICICAGSGGVGKTTTSAAIALGMAARGKKVAVLTIDPAKRLAGALGLPELGNEERRVEADVGRRAVGDDARRQAHLRRPDRMARARRADPRRGALQPDLSGAVERGRGVAGVHGNGEAHELHQQGRYDLLVLDTPLATRSTSSTRRRSRGVHRLSLAAVLHRAGVFGLKVSARAPGCCSR